MKQLNFIFLCAITFFLIFIFLGTPQIFNWDEGMWSTISKEMAQTQDFLTLSFLGQPYFLKPPLYFWLTNLAYKFFGISEFSTRFFSALLGASTILLLFWMGKIFYSKKVASLASYFLLSSVLFIASAKIGLLDTALIFFSFLAIFGLFIYLEKRENWGTYLAYFSLGLAFLAKGPLAVVLILAALVMQSLFERSAKIFTQAWHLKAALIGSLIPLFWFGGNLARHGYLFFEQFIIYNHFYRYVNTIMNDEPIYYYLVIFILGFMPLSFFFYDALLGFFKKKIAPDRLSSFLFFYIIFAFIIFSFGKDNAPGYILPAFPAYAILLARYFDHLIENPSKKVLGFFLVLFLGLIFILTAFYVKPLNLKEYTLPLQALLSICGLSYIAAFILFMRQKISLALASIITGQIIFILILSMWILPIYEKFNHPPIKQAAQFINQQKPGKVMAFRMSFFPSLYFYLNEPNKESKSKVAITEKNNLNQIPTKDKKTQVFGNFVVVY